MSIALTTIDVNGIVAVHAQGCQHINHTVNKLFFANVSSRDDQFHVIAGYPDPPDQ